MPPARHRTKQVGPSKPVDSAAQVAKRVGEKLRDIRRQQGHSLDTLARASGVSRAMLGQIETGKSAPTITLLWKITSALGVPVAALVTGPDEQAYHVERKAAASVTSTNGGRFETRTITAPDDAPETVFRQIRIEPGHQERIAAGRSPGRISLVVGRGSLDVAIGDEAPVRLAEGDAIFFSATQKHVLSNGGSGESIVYLVIAPQRSCRT
jgi:transcriptional regulator with XRE-family HTH domain